MRKLLFLISLSLFVSVAYAQTDTIRYVDGENGRLSNDGKSWTTAFKEVQDAINDLHSYLEANNLKSGSVYVKAGTYIPTESTEQSSSGILYTSFKIYDGIHVYGGFNATAPEAKPGDRMLESVDKTRTIKVSDRKAETGVDYWRFQSPTIFTGSHSSTKTFFTWDEAHSQYKTRFPGNSYHVVWFGTAGEEQDATQTAHYKALTHGASVDGVTIQEGNASNRTIASREHTGYGGGVYMVMGSILRNCIVKNCSAALRGGGIYMDGGGTVDHCLIDQCQTLGVGIIDGLGGGVAAEYKGRVRHSMITRCVARIGGGASLSYYKSKVPVAWKDRAKQFHPHLSSCIVVNNTAKVEAGGVVLDNGGTLNHCTVSNNDNRGVDVVYGGRRYGRSGGVYINQAGVVYNSVMSGNACAANNNIQYAAHVGTEASADITSEKPTVWYTAVQNHDISDWSNTVQHNVFSLANSNMPTGNAQGNHTLFHNPTTTPGAGLGTLSKVADWRPESSTYLRNQSVRMSKNFALHESLLESQLDSDIDGHLFDPISTLGGLLSHEPEIEVAQVAPVEKSDTEATLPTIFVDPSYVVTNHQEKRGQSWDKPLTSISHAIEFLKKYNGQKDQKVQILVKTGAVNTAGPSSYLFDANHLAELRTASIRPRSNMRIFGGYPKANTGTLTDGRNPVANPVTISANVINLGYENNSTHVVVFDNVHDVIFDGFKLIHGNAANANGSLGIPYGGGITVSNRNYDSALDPEGRINLTNNQLRNCVIDNCTAPDGGAAIYVAGVENMGTNANPSAQIVEASLKVINCVIHNNSSTAKGGVVTANGRATVTLDHCTVVGNVGYPLQTLSAKGYTGKIVSTNSVFFANTETESSSYDLLKSGTQKPLLAKGVLAEISGKNNIVDKALTVPAGLSLTDTKLLLGYSPDDKRTYCGFENPTRNIGARKNMDDLTVFGGVANFTPLDMNPIINMAISTDLSMEKDMTSQNVRTFGGAPDAGAIEDTTLPPLNDVLYVRMAKDGGDDSNNGRSWGTAFATIRHALDVATPGKQIWVAAGTYQEAATMKTDLPAYMLTVKPRVTVRGGFLPYGNPGMKAEERDISNLHPEYMTILDGGGDKIVIYQEENSITTENDRALWEGLTIQNGYSDIKRNGDVSCNGAGIHLANYATIKNCLIRNNHLKKSIKADNPILSPTNFRGGGAGIYVPANCIVENSVIRNNKFSNTGIGCGAGLYLSGGTLINSLIVENRADGGTNFLGAGVYTSAKSEFYNCTIAYNTGKVNLIAPGVWDNAVGGNGDLVNLASKFYNSIVWGNYGYGSSGENYNPFCRSQWQAAIGKPGFQFNSFHSVPLAFYASAGVNAGRTQITDPTLVYSANVPMKANDYSAEKVTAYYEACKAVDLFHESNYTYDADGFSNNPYILNAADTKDIAKYCINMGADQYGEQLKTKYKITEDIAGADRVQDCTIDKGAYEFNGAANIAPEMSKDKDGIDVATYYVTQNGAGVASASSPATAACMQKLQKVLDAAGRYKYSNPTHQVVVKLAAIEGGGYIPTRTAQTDGSEENPRNWSIQVPRGVEVWGGYSDKDNFSSRNILDNKTLLTGKYINDGLEVKVYHVVTFTDYLFDVTDKLMTAADGVTPLKLSDKLAATDYSGEFPKEAKYTRAVIDGLFVENGEAVGVQEKNQNGGGAIVTGFAHVRNCVIQNNLALERGGGLYVEDRGLVTGTIVQHNKANYGGGICVDDENNKEVSYKTYPLIYSSTVVKNTASVRGGGIWFLNNLRANSTVFWSNTSNDQGDVSGVTSKSAIQDITNFPLSYCAVTSWRIPGVNNIEVATEANLGVRWTDADTFYPLHVSSQLARVGMSYEGYQLSMQNIPSLEQLDINGVPRMEVTTDDQKDYDGASLKVKSNSNIEIGARAVNYDYNTIHSTNVTNANLLRRLFVAHAEDIDMERAEKLQKSGDVIYSQMGSSFANPFLRLDDALEYVINVRNSGSKVTNANNVQFEIFLDGGTFYPYTNIDHKASHSRSNTFVMPEGVRMIGSVNIDKPEFMYSQETTGTKVVNGVTLYGKTTDQIREAREHYDLNQNSIIEPWEMKKQTELSGVCAGPDNEVTNVYHVICMMNDATRAGALPTMYSDKNCTVPTTDRDQESEESLLRRTTVIDGVSITNGSARFYETNSIYTLNGYFRGGGIYVDGNERKTFTSADGTFGYSEEADAMQKGKRNLPLVVSNTLFQANNAIQGGAIFTNGKLTVIGCSFVQNFTSGPTGTAEQQSHDSHMATYSGGGCIATNNELLVVNSLFANNEAQRGVKDLSLAGSPEEITQQKPKNDNAVAYQGYGGVIWAGDDATVNLVNCNLVRNKSVAYPAIFNSVTNKPNDIRHLNANTIFWGNQITADAAADPEKKYNMHVGVDKVVSSYYCAYEEGSGSPVKYGSTTDFRDLQYDGNPLHAIASLKKDGVQYNQNIILDGNNDAVDGPNFVLPSNTAGVEGYMQSANWMIARVNRLADSGWGFLDQVHNDYVKEGNSFKGGGLYKVISDRLKGVYNLTLAPIGSETYLNYREAGRLPMNRIAKDPIITADKVYIDIGLYEYQHAVLNIAGDEIDTIWVSANENIDAGNDGRTWETPTSDLQRAIETLLLSRNDKPKFINIMEGTYSPVYQLADNNQGFQIFVTENTENTMLKSQIESGVAYGVSSLTIQGGFSQDVEGERDIEQYPVILKSVAQGSEATTNYKHLFYIVDTEQRLTSQAGLDISSRQTIPTHHAVPITFDGLTFVNSLAPSNGGNSGGAAIYYKQQFLSDADKKKTTDKLLLPPADGTPKLTIRNCVFLQNGAAADVPAVSIAKGGGEALIYNCVFHSNTGNPLEAVDTKVINSTFALNGGHVKLSESAYTYEDENTHVTTKYTSELHNSLIWKDNKGTGTQYEISSTATPSLSYNAITNHPTADDDANHNVALDDDNGELMTGPNFVDPENADLSKRNFHLQPAWRTISRADAKTFAEKALRLTGADLVGDVMLGKVADTKELAGVSRYYQGGIERGAYEMTVQMNRIYYVRPDQAYNVTQDGTTWDKAYGAGKLQEAVDGAALYSSVNNRRSYVLVQGNTNAEAAVNLRDGVILLGSLSERTVPEYSTSDEKGDRALIDMVNRIKAGRMGMAAQGNTNRTPIKGVTTSGTSTMGSLMDGFIISNQGILTKTPISLNAAKSVVRNCIVTGNTMNGNTPVVDLRAGLLYNTLIYGNKASQTVGQQGGMVLNCTVVGEQTGAITVNNNGGKVVNSLTWNSVDKGPAVTKTAGTWQGGNDASDGYPFTSYLTAEVRNVFPQATTMSAFYQPYVYQLPEEGLWLNTGTDDDAALDRNVFTKEFVDFDHDRDILGNPRLLSSGKVDAGCFETWRVAEGENVYTTNLTNTTVDLTSETARVYTENYGGNLYPHEGSVVYIGKNAKLNLNKSAAEAPIFTESAAFRPSYLLLQNGASLYGNGNVVRVQYMALEQTYPAGTKYQLLSLPFAHFYWKNIVQTTTNAKSEIVQTAYANLESAKTYNGLKRSAWDYNFQDKEATCWEDVAPDVELAANKGWLLTFGTPLATEQTLRFTSWIAGAGNYVYEEGSKPKTVTLTQYNTIDNSGSAHFTKAENMGWNLIGMPYLVNEYNTSLENGNVYSMNVPHVLYGMNREDGKYRSAGQMITTQSWAADNMIRLGDGYFTQTAVQGAEEKVTFALPVNTVVPTVLAAKAYLSFFDEYGGSDVVEVAPSTRATGTVKYAMGSDGLKWNALPSDMPSVYVNGSDGHRLSLVAETPMGQSIALGITAGSAGTYTLSLPEREAFAGVEAVWLTDMETGTTTDLLMSDYRLSLAEAGRYDKRLRLQMGGERPDGKSAAGNESPYDISYLGRTLYVRGLQGNDDIKIYTASGKLYSQQRTASTEFRQDLPSGVYIIMINNVSKKVYCK